MSRELANLARSNPHFTPTHILALSHRHPLANKERRRVVARESVQQWVWTSFRNSARTDRARFYHWEKADENGVVDPRKGIYNLKMRECMCITCSECVHCVLCCVVNQ